MSFQALPEKLFPLVTTSSGRTACFREWGGPCTARIIEMPLPSQRSIHANAQSTVEKPLYGRLSMCVTTNPSLNLPNIQPCKVIPGDFIAQLFCLLKQVIISGVLKCQCLCRVFLVYTGIGRRMFYHLSFKGNIKKCSFATSQASQAI